MAAEKKSPATPKPETLEEEAARLNTEITRYEDGVVPLYLELGSVLVRIAEERKFDWKGLLAYAAGTLNLPRSRCTRALRIYRLHGDDPSKVAGMTLFEALDQERGKPDPQPVGARMTDDEYRLARRYEQSMGGKKRALQILVWYLKGYTPQDGVPDETAAPDEPSETGKPAEAVKTRKSKGGAKRPAAKGRKVASSKKSR
jgi:hypothetical protein